MLVDIFQENQQEHIGKIPNDTSVELYIASVNRV